MATKVNECKFKIQYDWLTNSVALLDNEKQSSSVLSARLRKLEDRFTALTEAYEGLLLVFNESSDAEKVRSYDEKYKNATELYNRLDAAYLSYTNDDEEKEGKTTCQTRPRLPTINLTVFDGDVFKWTGFISLYKSLVMTRKDISRTEKYHYLITHLDKEPRSMLQHLPMEDDSLDTGLEILMGRYENIRLLADSHIARILNLPVLTKISELRTAILNPLLESTRALKCLNLPVDEWSYMLLHIGLSRLPFEVKSRFERNHGGGNTTLPTFSQLTEFLQNECRLVDTAVTGTNIPTKPARHVHVADVTALTKSNVGKFNKDVENPGTTCAYCSRAGHALTECRTFGKQLMPAERKEWIQTNGLCFRCFGQHRAATCTRNEPCGCCGHTGHHRMLCLALSYGGQHSGYPRRQPQGNTNNNINSRPGKVAARIQALAGHAANLGESQHSSQQ